MFNNCKVTIVNAQLSESDLLIVNLKFSKCRIA